MYAHPLAVKKWAKAMKPQAKPAQIEQARLMRAAKIARRQFEEQQLSLFPSGKKTARVAPASAQPSASPAIF